jgi:hypothetical protein
MRCAHPNDWEILARLDAQEDELYGEDKEAHEIGEDLRRPRPTPPRHSP